MKRIRQENLNETFRHCLDGAPKGLRPGKGVSEIYQRTLNHIPKTAHKILDAGCGLGIGANFYSEYEYEVSGCDFSSPLIKKATSTYPHIKFFVHDLMEPLIQTYDCIIATQVLEHVENPSWVLNNLISAATMVIISVPLGKKAKGNAGHLWRFSENDFLSYLHWVEIFNGRMIGVSK